MSLTYKINTATVEQIHALLMECDERFVPVLSSRTNLNEYARKLFERSVSFEAWHDSMMIGMVNAYLNDAEQQTGFITNVIVMERYSRRGVAINLLEMCLEHAQKLNCRRVILEVWQENEAAFRLYTRAGFTIIGERGHNLLMKHEILQNIT